MTAEWESTISQLCFSAYILPLQNAHKELKNMLLCQWMKWISEKNPKTEPNSTGDNVLTDMQSLCML